MSTRWTSRRPATAPSPWTTAVGAVVVTVVTVLAFGALGAPAEASPLGPGIDRSTVSAIEPPTDAFTLSAVADEYLRLRVAPGHEVVVRGYQGEAYLRVERDGTVLQNRWSPAVGLNADRYAATAPIAGADPNRTPEWDRVGEGGEVVWHDHRTHWMAPSLTPAVEPDGTIQSWTVALLVDGANVTVQGRLHRPPAPNPLPYLAGALAIAGLIIAAGRRHVVRVSVAAAVLASIAAATSAIAEWRSLPASIDRPAIALGLPLVAALLAASALVSGRSPHRQAARQAARQLATVVAAAGVLAGWFAIRLPGLWRAVLLTDVDPGVDRVLVALSLGAMTGAAIAAARSGQLRLPTPRPPASRRGSVPMGVLRHRRS